VGRVGNPICVTPNTLIHKNKGIAEIKNLKIGDKVLSHDGRYHEVIGVYKREYKGKIFKITVSNLGYTMLTPEHHILALRKEVVDWFAAEEVEIGDLILYPLTANKGIQAGSKITWLGNKYFLLPIKEIKIEDYEGQVFNLEVKETRSYVSDSLVLHNCGDIMEMQLKIKDGIIVDAKFKTFGCLPATEEIVLAKGGWKEISKISEGEKVINEEGRETQVLQTQVRDFNGNLVTITPFVSPFNAFSITSDHPILAIKRDWLRKTRISSYKCAWKRISDEQELLNYVPNYVKARDLRTGDYLIFAVNKQIKDNSIYTKEVMRLLGYYLSEGYSSAQGSVVAFAFNKNEVENIKETKYLLEKIVGKKAKERTRGSVTEVYVCSRKLFRFLYSTAGRYARYKSLAKEVMILPFEKQWEMISTYLKGDGDFYRRREKESETYRITTASRNLAIQIQEILARGGIFASIREIYKKNCVIEGRKIKDSKMYLISYKLSRKHKFVRRSAKYFLVPIKKIERKSFRGKVYNFLVANEPNSYLVKGFAVHNCGAAIATSSMATEMIKGKTIEEALKLTNQAVAEALDGLPPVKMHCSVLAEDAVKAAIDDYLRKTTGKGLEGWKPRSETEEHKH